MINNYFVKISAKSGLFEESVLGFLQFLGFVNDICKNLQTTEMIVEF